MRQETERRLVKNEAVFRRANEQVIQGIAELDALALEDGQPEHSAGPRLVGRVLHFYCECSSDTCLERVQLTLGDYQKIHEMRNHFVVVPGHEMPSIERVASHHEPEYNVVEKLTSVPLMDQS